MKTNLSAVRKAAGYTQKEASALSGIPLGTLRRWEQGANEPDMQSIIQLATLYKCSTDEILGSKFGKTVRRIGSSMVDVPLYGSIAAGTPIEMIAIEDTQQVPEKVYAAHPSAFLLRVEGESMNRILPNGCLALVDPCTEVERDGLPYAVCVNGYDATIKRVRKLNNGFVLEPDSTDPTYQSKVFNFNEPDTMAITIIGRVVFYVLPTDWEF